MGKSNNKQFLVIGLGRFGSNVAINLEKFGFDVIAIDSNESIVQKLSSKLTYVVSGNAADEQTLKALGVEKVDTAIVSMKDLQSSVLCTLLLKEFGVNRIVVKASDDNHGKILEKIGATQIVYSERETAKRVANTLYTSEIYDYVELPNGTAIVTLKAPEFIVGKTPEELNFYNEYNAMLVGIKRGDVTVVNPNRNEVFQASDYITVYGAEDSLQNLNEKYFKL